MPRMNYHHLYYFWRVASAGNLTQVAKEIHLSQSALSAQLKQFQHNLDMELFEREGRKLVLTAEGRKVLEYAEDIFSRGAQLEQAVKSGFAQAQQHVSIGVLTNLSRNFIESFILPLMQQDKVTFSLQSRDMQGLLEGLNQHHFDLILTNHNVEVGQQEPLWRSELLSRQPIEIVAPATATSGGAFPHGFADVPWVLPAKGSEIRSAFNVLCARHQYEPVIKAQTDDMAMLRLLARDSGAYSVLPAVVVRDEIAQGKLKVLQSIPGAFEHFYAVTLARKALPKHIRRLIDAARS